MIKNRQLINFYVLCSTLIFVSNFNGLYLHDVLFFSLLFFTFLYEFYLMVFYMFNLYFQNLFRLDHFRFIYKLMKLNIIHSFKFYLKF